MKKNLQYLSELINKFNEYSGTGNNNSNSRLSSLRVEDKIIKDSPDIE